MTSRHGTSQAVTLTVVATFQQSKWTVKTAGVVNVVLIYLYECYQYVAILLQSMTDWTFVEGIISLEIILASNVLFIGHHCCKTWTHCDRIWQAKSTSKQHLSPVGRFLTRSAQGRLRAKKGDGCCRLSIWLDHFHPTFIRVILMSKSLVNILFSRNLQRGWIYRVRQKYPVSC